MKILGAIIAGGKATRFGGDKAAALLNGKALIDHVADGLRPQVEALVVCGREWPGIESIADRPAPGMGPLGGLNAALHAAQQNGFDAVLSAGCDVLPVPDFRRLSEGEDGAVVVKDHCLFGLWPTVFAAQLDSHLSKGTDRSMRHWIATSGAHEVACDTVFHNLNTQADFMLYASAQGLAA
jgi:molybdenum cofactor guanylyltransferase